MEEQFDINKMSLNEIINHPDFYSLTNNANEVAIYKEQSIYWKVLFRTKQIDNEGNWVLFGSKHPQPFVQYFKKK